MKIAIAQMQSSSELERNLIKMETFTAEAADSKSDLVIFPEMAYFTGTKEQWLPIVPEFEELKATFIRLSQKYKLALCPGSLREPVPGDPSRYFNTLLFIYPDGRVLTYRKIFLYEAVLPDKTYEESKYCAPGNELSVVPYKGLKIGFAICFDLRFPEVFRALKKKEAQLILLPSAFTIPTGKAHWETLVRARAIENQCFMAAPDLTGTSGDGAKVYGHSLAVNPWGEILCSFENEEGVKVVALDKGEIERAASKVASWKCRREDLFPIR